jgi:hypothetical protein
MDSQRPATTSQQPQRAIGADVVAVMLGCGVRKARELMKSGEIVSRRVGRGWRCWPESVVDYLKSVKPEQK